MMAQQVEPTIAKPAFAPGHNRPLGKLGAVERISIRVPVEKRQIMRPDTSKQLNR